MISPTIGRVVWYRPSLTDHATMKIIDDQPLSAMIAYVWSDHLVNLTVSDHGGATHARPSVALRQGDEHDPADAPFCEWMPYQKGQAAKTEATAAELGAAVRKLGLADPLVDPHKPKATTQDGKPWVP